MLLQLIGIALIQSVLQLILSDRRAEAILKLIGGAAMVSVLISGLTGFDYHAYASALRRTRAPAEWSEEKTRQDVDQLRRRYIEAECAAYIIEKASQMQIELDDVQVSAEWNAEGYWYPVHVEIVSQDQSENRVQLQRMIESELGISAEDQSWRGG